MAGREGRTLGMEVVPIGGMAEQVPGEVLAAKGIIEQRLLVDDAPDGDVPAGEIGVRGVFEIAVGVRVVELAMLGE